MIGTRAEHLLRHLRQDLPDDAELVRRFRRGDREAFEDLVRRHGPLVLEVCLRTTRHRQDAEDAFQATFITLARKAELIRDPMLLGNWLHGVALRIALRAKRGAGRRRMREVQAVNVPEPAATAATPPFEHGAAIHEEIERLPEAMRDAVLLCELRGVSRSEAAAVLHIPEGTLSSRLAAGRKNLAERLARRGIVPGAALVSLAVVPESLIAATSRIAAGVAIPANIERLMRGGFSMRKVLIGVLGFSLSVAAAVYAGRSEEESEVVKALPIVDKLKDDAKPEEKLEAVMRPQLRTTLDIDHHANQLIWSPDGKWFVVGVGGPDQRDRIVFVGQETPARGEMALVPSQRLVGITPDSKHVITDLRESGLLSGRHAMRLWNLLGDRGGPMSGPPFAERAVRFELSKEHVLEPDSTRQYGFPAGGERLRTVHTSRARLNVLNRVEIFESKFGEAATKSVFKSDAECESTVLSPSGGRVALLNKMSVTVHDIAAGKKATFDKLPEANPPLKENDGRRRTAAFSADESLIVTALVGRSPVIFPLNGDKPVILEGDDSLAMYVHEASFSPRNRLVAIRGVRYGKVERGPKSPAEGVVGSVLILWDVQTGKIVRTWEPFDVKAVFHPRNGQLAITETNGLGTRIGFWEFIEEWIEKK